MTRTPGEWISWSYYVSDDFICRTYGHVWPKRKREGTMWNPKEVKP